MIGFPYQKMVDADNSVKHLRDEGSMCSRETDFRLAGLVYGLLLYHRPKKILEIGSFVGQTATFVQNTIECAPSAFNGVVQYVCVDMNIQRLRGSPLQLTDSEHCKFEYRDGLSRPCLDVLIQSGDKFEFVIVDGSHAFKCALEDLHRVAHLITEHGTIFVHDTANATGEVRRAVDQFLHNWNGVFTAVHFGSEYQGATLITRSHRIVWDDNIDIIRPN